MNKFSKYLASKRNIVRNMINTLSQQYPFVSILGTDVSGFKVMCDNKNTSIAPSNVCESGFCIKVYNDGIYSEYSVNDINKSNFNEIIEHINELTKEDLGPHVIKVKMLEEEEIKKHFKRNNIGEELKPNYIVEVLRNHITETIKDNEIIACRIMFDTMEVSKMYYSNKKELEQYYPYTSINTYVMCRRGNDMKYGYSGDGTCSQVGALDLIPELLKSSITDAKLLFDAELPTPGIYDVITDPGVTGLIVHEAFGHGVEMDMFVKDRAKSKEYINKQVASEIVNMHDGASAAFCVASYFFDDDGVLAHDTKIIENGILKRGISDALSALELGGGTEPTGNGRRESYKRKSYTRMTNTFFEKGTSKLSDMIKSIEYGYMLCRSNNGMEDPKNWGIQCTAYYGKEIKNGEFTGKVISPVVLSGYVVDLLCSISAISTDFEINGSGFCGKGYKEWVKVSDGGAYMKAKVKIG